MYETDERIVMTLDAGGTNLVFSAIQANQTVVEPITLAACHDSLENCLLTLLSGFRQISERLLVKPVAISFAFPGPADYERGIIGDLTNFPFFRGGIALKDLLQDEFRLPVFINNDGNLFAYGEALAGLLPSVNRELEANQNPQRYRNLLGITLGTGFGGGVVLDNRLLTGDNGCGGDVWLNHNKKHPELIAEESISIRAVKRVYGELSGDVAHVLSPKDIFDIAEGNREGNRQAAINSFEELGEVLGDAISQTLNIVDGIVVIGGGLIGASKYILPAAIKELKGALSTIPGERIPIIQSELYDLTDAHDFSLFMKNETTKVKVPFSDKEVVYHRKKKIGIGISRIGTSHAVSLGAYAFALNRLDNH